MTAKISVIHRKTLPNDPLIIECRMLNGEFTTKCGGNFSPSILKHKLAIDCESADLINTYFNKLCQHDHINPKLSMLDKLIIIELHRIGLLPFLQDLCAEIHDNYDLSLYAPASPYDLISKLKRYGFYKSVIRSLPYNNNLDDLTSGKCPTSAGKYEYSNKDKPGDNTD